CFPCPWAGHSLRWTRSPASCPGWPRWGGGRQAVKKITDQHPGVPSFAEVMARLRAGQDDAAAQVFDRFAGHLVALARKHLDAQVLQKVDPEDVLQSVCRSFFARYPSGQLGGFASWDNLWAMLVVITLRKCGRQMDYFHAACRDVRREVAPAPGPGEPDPGAGEATPAEA